MSAKCGVLAALAVVLGTAQAADYYPDVKVVSATLYDGYGDVLRQGQVDIREAGTHHIWLGQPLAGSKGTGDVLVSGAQVRSRNVRPNEQALQSNQAEHVIAAQVRRESTRRALEDNERQAQAVAKRLELADANANAVKSALAQLAEEQKTLVHRHAEAERALARALALQEWAGDTSLLPLSMVLEVVVDKPGKVNISWREQSTAVFWKPALQLALDSKTQRLHWQAEALVSQKSGVDFDDISLHLASGVARDVEKPALHPVIVRLGERHHLQERVLAAMDIPASAKQRGDEAEQARAATKDIRLPGHYSLPSGNHPLTVTYQQGAVDAEVYRAVYGWEKPQVALVVADFILPDMPAFVPGNTQFYRDGTLVAERELLQAWHGGERFSLSFGEDVALKVRQYAPADARNSKSATALEYETAIEVGNGGSIAQPVRVYALLPVAGDKDIQIKPVWPQMPEASDVEGVKGLVYWQKSLAPGDSWTVRHGYSISYPQGKQIIGL